MTKDYIGKTWKNKRIAAGYTQKELSIKTGLSVHTIQNIEQNKRFGSVDTIAKINKVLLTKREG